MNIDIVLFAGRIVLVALLYIFLFAVMKTGVGLVRGQRRDSAIWTIDVDTVSYTHLTLPTTSRV